MTSTCLALIVLFFATFGAADSFSDCVVRKLYSIEENSDVESVTAKLMEAVSRVFPAKFHGLELSAAVANYGRQLLATDCTDDIDAAFSSNDKELQASYIDVALMESVHELDIMMGTHGRRKLLLFQSIFGLVVVVGIIYDQYSVSRRALLNGIVSVSPSSVMNGCAHSASASVCSGGVTALAADFLGPLCGGSDSLNCDISTESFEVLYDGLSGPESVAMNLGQEKEVGHRLRNINKSLRQALNTLLN